MEDWVSLVNQRLQALGYLNPAGVLIESDRQSVGPPHIPYWTIRLDISVLGLSAQGEGTTLKEAKRDACRKLYEKMKATDGSSAPVHSLGMASPGMTAARLVRGLGARDEASVLTGATLSASVQSRALGSVPASASSVISMAETRAPVPMSALATSVDDSAQQVSDAEIQSACNDWLDSLSRKDFKRHAKAGEALLAYAASCAPLMSTAEPLAQAYAAESADDRAQRVLQVFQRWKKRRLLGSDDDDSSAQNVVYAVIHYLFSAQRGHFSMSSVYGLLSMLGYDRDNGDEYDPERVKPASIAAASTRKPHPDHLGAMARAGYTGSY